jgi:pimeloyl-ACP methyl ester carboxylesterase
MIKMKRPGSQITIYKKRFPHGKNSLSATTVLSKCLLMLLLPFILVFPACEKEKDQRQEPEYLVNSELIASYSVSDITAMLGSSGALPQGFASIVSFGVNIYRIVYNTTDTGGNPVLASGALVVPDDPGPMPLMSFQHGTLGSEEEAPSYFTSGMYLPAVLYASTGYIISIPDYLGYGSSKHIDHPYEHGHSLATASRDMLRAVREFDMENKRFKSGSKLFLTGYSQGGYATMALLKILEEDHADEFMVTAATAGAGAYNKTEFSRQILEWEGELSYLNYFLWVLDTYNRVYNLNRPYNHFFNDPYAAIIESEGVFANPQLDQGQLFTDSFRAGILNGTDSGFIEAIADNDNFDWLPVTPLQLYHGTDDDFVFFFNSSSANYAMKERGASRVELIPVQDKDHSGAVVDYFLGTILFFSQF